MTILPKFVDRQVQVYSIGFGDVITKPENIDLFSQILGPFAKSEMDAHSLRAQERQAMNEGPYLGGKIPFGFRLAQNGTIEKDCAQQAAIRKNLTALNLLADVPGNRAGAPQERWLTGFQRTRKMIENKVQGGDPWTLRRSSSDIRSLQPIMALFSQCATCRY